MSVQVLVFNYKKHFSSQTVARRKAQFCTRVTFLSGERIILDGNSERMRSSERLGYLIRLRQLTRYSENNFGYFLLPSGKVKNFIINLF